MIVITMASTPSLKASILVLVMLTLYHRLTRTRPSATWTGAHFRGTALASGIDLLSWIFSRACKSARAAVGKVAFFMIVQPASKHGECKSESPTKLQSFA
jgi:hypothetical protein